MDVIVPQSSEIKIKQEPNETATINLTTTKDSIQSSQAAKANETSKAEFQSDNKTTNEITILKDAQKPSFLNTKILLFSAVVFITFLVVFFVINRIRKRKKGSEEEQEALKEI